MTAQAWFYNAHVRRLITGFGQIFSGLNIVRFGSNGAIIEIVTEVPCENTNVDKSFERRKIQKIDDGDLNTKNQVVFPRIGYKLTGMSYALNRQAAMQSRFLRDKDIAAGTARLSESPVPYDFGFEVIISARNLSDATQLVEQILPKFKPAHTLVLQDIPFIEEHIDVPIILQDVTFEDSATDPLDDGTRQVIFTLGFVAQYQLYGPTGSAGEVQVNTAIDEKLGTNLVSSGTAKIIKKTKAQIFTEADQFYDSTNADLVWENNG